jgi:hypothetical protein
MCVMQSAHGWCGTHCRLFQCQQSEALLRRRNELKESTYNLLLGAAPPITDQGAAPRCAAGLVTEGHVCRMHTAHSLTTIEESRFSAQLGTVGQWSRLTNGCSDHSG